jgi:GNAT superfamily N-acetyltransferase
MAEVRIAVLEDAKTIAEFNQQMAIETEDKQLDSETILAGVQSMINDKSLGFYLVACIDSKVVGCLGITTEWSDWRNGLFWWIQSVYVSTEYRSHGAFSSLYHYVSDLAKKQGNVCGIRLYAEKDNDRALRTYFKLGMVETEYRILEEEF